MILAITLRYDFYENDKHFKERFYLSKCFKDIFEKLNILLLPVVLISFLLRILGSVKRKRLSTSPGKLCILPFG